MQTRLCTAGIHHITAISGSARENYRFYTEVLGLRLVKKTVNFDDPETYHLYYGDERGTPGTLLTFFPWEHMQAGRTGNGQVAALAFAVAADSETFWRRRLEAEGLPVTVTRRFEDVLIRFTDPHGLPLELVLTETPPETAPWSTAAIPRAHAVRGFHSATARMQAASKTEGLITQVLGMEPIGRESGRTRFRVGSNLGPGLVFDLVEDPGGPTGRSGVGTVHHIAFRADDDRQQRDWQKAAAEFGLEVTPVIDRNYFRSIYFRDPGGVLFEIATDPPGFTVDEELASLGRGLMLPPRYEAQRRQIEAHLPPLDTSGEGTEKPAMLAG